MAAAASEKSQMDCDENVVKGLHTTAGNGGHKKDLGEGIHLVRSPVGRMDSPHEPLCGVLGAEFRCSRVRHLIKLHRPSDGA